MEMGLTYIKLNEFELANYWFEKAKKDYSGYLLETLLHFRVHCGQRLIKKAKKKQIEAALELQQQQQQVKLINEQNKANETTLKEQLKEPTKANLKSGTTEDTNLEETKLTEVIKLKNKLNDSLKIDDKLIEYLNDKVEVSSNNL